MDVMREMYTRWAAGDMGRDKAAGVPVLLATYRLAPAFRFPAQIEDAVTAYRWVADRTGAVALAGDSSGGGLAVRALIEQYLPPASIQCGGDETGRGDSERLAELTGARLDVVEGQLHTFQMAAGAAAGGADLLRGRDGRGAGHDGAGGEERPATGPGPAGRGGAGP
ncbi:alpha/beta hydrolase [Actinoplanes sp. CA-131856]